MKSGLWGLVGHSPPHLKVRVCVRAQSCQTLCDTMDYSPPGSSVHGVLQARMLEWIAVPSSRDLPNPDIKSGSLTSPALADGFFTTSISSRHY